MEMLYCKNCPSSDFNFKTIKGQIILSCSCCSSGFILEQAGGDCDYKKISKLSISGHEIECQYNSATELNKAIVKSSKKVELDEFVIHGAKFVSYDEVCEIEHCRFYDENFISNCGCCKTNSQGEIMDDEPVFAKGCREAKK